MVIIHYEKLKVLLLALYITIVVFAIAFAFQYIQHLYNISIPYSEYIWEIAAAISALAIGYAIISIMVALIERYAARRFDKVGVQLLRFVAQVIGYSILVLILFDIFNVNPSTLLVEGAVGGVILGLALQTLTPAIFSGVLISSSRTIATGDVVLLESYYWGVTTPKFCKVKKVGIIFTQFHDSSAHLMTIPNLLLVNSAISTRLEDKGVYKNSIPVSIRNDVSAQIFEKYAVRYMENAFSESDLQLPRILISNTAEKTLVYSVTFYFKDIYEVDETIDKIQKSMDQAYWSARKDPVTKRHNKL